MFVYLLSVGKHYIKGHAWTIKKTCALKNVLPCRKDQFSGLNTGFQASSSNWILVTTFLESKELEAVCHEEEAWDDSWAHVVLASPHSGFWILPSICTRSPGCTYLAVHYNNQYAATATVSTAVIPAEWAKARAHYSLPVSRCLAFRIPFCNSPRSSNLSASSQAMKVAIAESCFPLFFAAERVFPDSSCEII